MPIVPVPSTVAEFRDALGLAFELSDEFAFAQAVVTTDHLHRCIDFAVFTEIGDGLAPTLNWLSDRIGHRPRPRRVLLISIRSIDGIIVAERDLAEFRFAQQAVDRLGARLIDWIETDGELVRSYAYLANPHTTWSAQARAEGALDVADW